MKGVFLKYMSALLAVWYCVSIIGFDVHSCNITGNTFVSSLLSGTSCDDVHPEHDCGGHSSCCKSHASSCCHSHKCNDIPSESETGDEGCCSNDIEVLDSEGVQTQNDNNLQIGEYVVLHYYACDQISCNYTSVNNIKSNKPDSGKWLEPDTQAVLNVWRI